MTKTYLIPPAFPADHTSNDLLLYLRMELSRRRLHYTIIAQSEDEVRALLSG